MELKSGYRQTDVGVIPEDWDNVALKDLASMARNAIVGGPREVADRLEEVFEATGSRGGFMLSHSQAAPRQLLHNVVDMLVPELQRRGRFRTAYTGRTLRENLAE